jgi:hypothetical protein
VLYIVPYFDEDFDLKVMHAVEKNGFQVHCARDEGLIGKSDGDHLAYAAERGWTVVTFNRGDFAALHTQYMTTHREHAGIVVSVKMETGRAVRALLNLLDRVSADEARNQIFFLQNFE